MDARAETRGLRRAAVLVVLAILLVACGKPQPATVASASPVPSTSTSAPARKQATCASEWRKKPPRHELPPPLGRLENRPIRGIRVRGNQRVPEASIRSKLRSAIGAKATAATIRQNLAQVWATGEFDDVTAEVKPFRDGILLEIVTVERPLVGAVFAVGTEDFESEVLNALDVQPGSPFSAFALHVSKSKLNDVMTEKGYGEAKIAWRARREGQEIDICLVVDRGPRITIGNLQIVGNAVIPTAELLLKIETKGGTINTVGSVLQRDHLEHDLLRMTADYYDRGMVNANVALSEVTLDRAKHTQSVVITISEGQVFRVGKLRVTGKRIVREKEYLALLKARSGKIFSRTQMHTDLQRIRELHEARGHKSPTVTPLTAVDADKSTIDVNFEIGEPE